MPRVLLCAVILLVLPPSGWASPQAQAASLSIEDFGKGDYVVEGRFQVKASRTQVWQVLTDYEHMPEFVSSMRVSHVEQRHEDILLVKQIAEGKFLFISKKIHLLLAVTEKPMDHILFEDTLRKDFESYQGSWEIEEGKAGGMEVIYRLNAHSHVALPNVLAKGAFRSTCQKLLDEVKAEIFRRSAN